MATSLPCVYNKLTALVYTVALSDDEYTEYKETHERQVKPGSLWSESIPLLGIVENQYVLERHYKINNNNTLALLFKKVDTTSNCGIF